MKPLKWTKAREQAAELVAADRETDDQIAARLGITRDCLARWKRHPDFRARVAEIVEAERAAVLAEGIRNKRNRLTILDDQAQRLRRTIAARAADPSLAAVPGGPEGVITAEPMLVKVYGDLDAKGRFQALGESELVYRYSVDTGTLKEIRETLKQAAQEVGEWAERREVTGKDGKPIEVAHHVDLSGLSDAELGDLERILAKTADAGRGPGGEGSA